MKLISSRQFNQDVTRAKRQASVGPLFVTDRGRPTHVLMSIAAFRRMTGQTETIVDMLAMPDASGMDVALADISAAWQHQERAD